MLLQAPELRERDAFYMSGLFTLPVLHYFCTSVHESGSLATVASRQSNLN